MKCTNQVNMKGILLVIIFLEGHYLSQESYLQGLEEVALVVYVSSTSLPSKDVCIIACSPVPTQTRGTEKPGCGL